MEQHLELANQTKALYMLVTRQTLMEGEARASAQAAAAAAAATAAVADALQTQHWLHAAEQGRQREVAEVAQRRRQLQAAEQELQNQRKVESPELLDGDSPRSPSFFQSTQTSPGGAQKGGTPWRRSSSWGRSCRW